MTDGPAKSVSCQVLIVDDHEVVREALIRIIKSYPDIEVVGEAADGLHAIELAERLEPDVILMDISLGDMSGIEATRHILVRNPGIKVIGLSVNSDKEVADAMRAAGAVAYLNKSAPSAALIETVRSCGRKATS